MPDARYFELSPDVDPGEPLNNAAVNVPRPALIAGKPGEVLDRVVLSPLSADSRTTSTGDPAVADVLLSTGLWVEVDKPKTTKKEG